MILLIGLIRIIRKRKKISTERFDLKNEKRIKQMEDAETKTIDSSKVSKEKSTNNFVNSNQEVEFQKLSSKDIKKSSSHVELRVISPSEKATQPAGDTKYIATPSISELPAEIKISERTIATISSKKSKPSEIKKEVEPVKGDAIVDNFVETLKVKQKDSEIKKVLSHTSSSKVLEASSSKINPKTEVKAKDLGKNLKATKMNIQPKNKIVIKPTLKSSALKKSVKNKKNKNPTKPNSNNKNPRWN